MPSRSFDTGWYFWTKGTDTNREDQLTLQWIPGVPVSDAVGEVPLVLTLISFRHVGIPGSIGICEVLKNVIIWG